MKCPHCEYEWENRTADPKECPRCKGRLDRSNCVFTKPLKPERRPRLKRNLGWKVYKHITRNIALTESSKASVRQVLVYSLIVLMLAPALALILTTTRVEVVAASPGTFGYETPGTLGSDTLEYYMRGSTFTCPSAGTATSITVYLLDDIEVNKQCAIYKHGDSTVLTNGTTEIKTDLVDPAGWLTFTFSTPPTLEADTEYVLEVRSDDMVFVYYDAGDTGQGHYQNGGLESFPATASFTHEDRKYSIYCNYAPDVGPPTQPTLYLPTDGSTLPALNDTPYFEWTEGENTTSHRLLIDNDPDFLSPEENRTLTDNFYTIADENALPYEDNYSWKVGADNGDWENWSAVWTFIVTRWKTPPSVENYCGEETGYEATKSIDNDTNSAWGHNLSHSHYITFDLERLCGITKIRLYQGSIALQRWGQDDGLTVYISEDNVTWGDNVWQGALDAEGWQESGAFEKLGRYIRLVSLAESSSEQIREFQAYVLPTWQLVENWTGTVLASTPVWNLSETWTGTVEAYATWQLTENWIGTVQNPHIWRLIETWSGTLKTVSPTITIVYGGKENVGWVNNVRMPDNQMSIKVHITYDTPVENVILEWYDNGDWENYEMADDGGDNYVITMSNLENGRDYSFDVWVIVEGAKSESTWLRADNVGVWVRRYIGANYAIVDNLQYDQFYFHNADYTNTDSKCLEHEQNADGSVLDTNYMQREVPATTMYGHCDDFVLVYMNENLTISDGTVVDNIYYYFWWYENFENDTYVYLHYSTYPEITNRDKYWYDNLNIYRNENKKTYPITGLHYSQYILNAGFWDLTADNSFNSLNIYDFSLTLYRVDDHDIEWVSKEGLTSYIIINLPDNETLAGMDSDSDGWDDNYELYTSYTNPFQADTDTDGIIDSEDSDPLIPQANLYLPENNSTVDNTPYFEWTRAANVDNHRLLVDNDSDFSSPNENRVFTTENSYTIPDENVLPDDNYHWKVIVEWLGGSSESETWTFQVTPHWRLIETWDGSVEVPRAWELVETWTGILQNPAPPSVENLYITDMDNVATDNLTPETQYKFWVEIEDNDTLADIENVTLVVYLDNENLADNAVDHYTFRWTRDGGFEEVGPGGVMENDPSTVGTSTSQYATRMPHERKVFYAKGRYWAFYGAENNDNEQEPKIMYKTSTDGISWSENIIIRDGYYNETYKNHGGAGFSVWLDGNNVHYSYAQYTSLYYRMGTLDSDGAITWATSEQTVASGTYYHSQICVDSNGYPWIGYYDDIIGRITKSDNKDGTWQTSSSFPENMGTNVDDICIIPLTDGKVYAVGGQKDDVLKGRLWNGSSFEDVENVSSSNLGGYRATFSAVAIGNDIHIVFLDLDEFANEENIFHVKRTYGVGWGDETLIQHVPYNLPAPTLTKTSANNLYCFWLDGDSPVGMKVYYKKYHDGSWDADKTTWINETPEGVLKYNTITSSYQSYGGEVCVAWTSKSSSPYNVRFAKFSDSIHLIVENCIAGDNTKTVDNIVFAIEFGEDAQVTANDNWDVWVQVYDSAGNEDNRFFLNRFDIVSGAEWNLVETWTGTVEAPAAWQEIESWTGTVKAIAEWTLIEEWTGAVQTLAVWQLIETWDGTIEATVQWNLIEEWSGSIQAPSAWQLIEEWSGAVEASAAWGLIEEWSGTVQALVAWTLIETWDGTVEALAQWQLIEEWSGAVESPSVWNLIETWSGTVEAPVGWNLIEEWNGTVQAPTAWILLETWSGTIEAPSEWQQIESWTGTMEAPSEWTLIEQWDGTVIAPVAWGLIESWDGTVEAFSGWQLVEEWDGTIEAYTEWTLIEEWSGTVQTPSAAVWNLLETWTGTIQAPAEWQLIESWTGTIETPAQWSLVETWSGTIEVPAGWWLMETWSGTIEAFAGWNLIETWTGTIETLAEWSLIESWSGTIEAPVAWQLTETWSGTVEAPTAWQLVEQWSGTIQAISAWDLVESWSGTVEAPSEWSEVESWTGTICGIGWMLVETWDGTVRAPAWSLIETWTGSIQTPAVYAVSISITPSENSGTLGATLTYTVIVVNIGGTIDNYDLTSSDAQGWTTYLDNDNFINVSSGENRETTLNVGLSTTGTHEVIVTAIGTGVSDSDNCTAISTTAPDIVQIGDGDLALAIGLMAIGLAICMPFVVLIMIRRRREEEEIT